MPARTSLTVTEHMAGARLDVFLANCPEIGNRAVAKELIDGGQVTVAGRTGRPGQFVAPGQQVEFVAADQPVRDPLVPDLPLPEVRILYDDPDLCVIDKPPGLAAHPSEDRSQVAHTVASWAQAKFGRLPSPSDVQRPGIVHRLDRDTSGVMVIAKTESAMGSLRAQWKARAVEKEYRCIVYGEPRFQSDWIERPIASDPRHPDRMTVVDAGGRDAATFYEVLERFAGFAHVKCLPKTGRTHQIRVHMTAISHSLVGDRVYRSRARQHDVLPAGAPQPRRQCLHARRLALLHPATQAPMVFEAPIPPDMAALLQWLRTAGSLPVR